MTKDEWILVGQAKKGDTHAFATLYSRYYEDLYRFALCYMRQTEAAEDAVMNSVLRAYEQIHTLRKDTAFRSWLYTITANECRRMLQRTPYYLEDMDWLEPHGEEEGYDDMEIMELLGTLSESERMVITLSVYGGYTSSEIAKILKKRPGSIRSIKSRALAALRERMTNSDERKEASARE